MTRQKKEILKKIEEMDNWIAADMELGCGFAPADAYEGMEREIGRLQEQLAHLRHFETAEAMFYDERGQVADASLPW